MIGRVWANETALAAKGAVTQVDLLGQASELKLDAGKAKVKLTEAPIYLVPAPLAEVEKLLKD